MKVLLAYPNVGAQVGFNYGLSYIGACLKRAGHEVTLLDINDRLGSDLDDEGFLREVERTRPDLVGFSVVTPQWPRTRQYAAALKRRHPEIPVVCGGIHATTSPEETIRSGVVDYVIRGEGEAAVCELAEAIGRGAPVDGIANLCYRGDDGAVRCNAVRPFAPLDTLPAKDYEAFDFQKMIDAKNGWVGLMTSRGCPFRCTYCFNHAIVELYKADTGLGGRALNYIRHHDIDTVMREIDYLLANYRGIRMFIFDDDLFTFDRDYVLAFCREYGRRVDVPFVCNAHVKVFDRELAEALLEAGCRIVKFGLESGSERVRTEVMHRYMTNDEIERAFAVGNAAGLHTSAFVMIGLPGETHDERMETVDLLARTRPGRFRWSVFFPFPGTQAAELSAELGQIDRGRLERLVNFTDESCLDFGPVENLHISKLARAMPWFVNARSGGAQADAYREKVEQIVALGAEGWAVREASIRDEDAALSERLLAEGVGHYAIKYNPFMAVASDYFTREDA